MTTQATGANGNSQKAAKGEVTNYGKWLDVTKGPPVESDLNGFISWRIDRYEDEKFRDYELWEAFLEDFIDFTEPLFQLAGKDYVRNLRNFLCANGVYVHKQARVSMAKELFKVLQEDKPHEWTNDEIEGQINSAQGFNSILKSRLPATSITPAINITIPAPPTTIATMTPAPTTPAPAFITTTTGESGSSQKALKVEIVQEDEPHQWTKEEAEDQINYEKEDQGDEDIPLDEPDLHDDLETLILETNLPHDDPEPGSDQSITILGTIDGPKMLENPANKATYHISTRTIKVLNARIGDRKSVV